MGHRGAGDERRGQYGKGKERRIRTAEKTRKQVHERKTERRRKKRRRVRVEGREQADDEKAVFFFPQGEAQRGRGVGGGLLIPRSSN